MNIHVTNEHHLSRWPTAVSTNNQQQTVNLTVCHICFPILQVLLYLYTVNSKTAKLSVGLLTLLPLVFLVLFFFALISGGLREAENALASDEPLVFLLPVGYAVVLLIAAIFSNLALSVFYLIHVLNNARLDASQRLVWVFPVLFGGFLGCLIYWLFQIWREEDDRVEHTYNS